MGRRCNSLFILCGVLSHTRLFNHISARLETNDSTGCDTEHPPKRSTRAVAIPIMSIQTQPRQWNQNVRKRHYYVVQLYYEWKAWGKKRKKNTWGPTYDLLWVKTTINKQTDTNCVMKSNKQAGKRPNMHLNPLHVKCFFVSCGHCSKLRL